LNRDIKCLFEALAEIAGIDRSYMGGIERGEHNVALMNLLRITEALGMKLSKLIARTGN
jgi:transcriptional regulator with XRE-family HTH domain